MHVQNSEAPAAFVETLKRGFAVVGQHHLVAALFEDALDDHPVGVVIVRHQDARPVFPGLACFSPLPRRDADDALAAVDQAYR